MTSEDFTFDKLPGDIYDCIFEFLDTGRIYSFLLISKNITISKLLLDRRKWQKKSIEYWAKVGDLKAVQFLHTLKKTCKDEAILLAIENGHLEVVKFLLSIGVFHPDAFNWACQAGHLEIIKYIHSMNKFNICECYYDCEHNYAMNLACSNGHLEVVIFLHSIGVIFYNAIAYASSTGQMEVIKYLLSVKITCSTDAIDWASRYGHLQVVKYLHDIGAPYSQSSIYWAKRNKHLAVIDFLKSTGLHD